MLLLVTKHMAILILPPMCTPLPVQFSTDAAAAQDPCHHHRDDEGPREADGGIDAPPLAEPGDLFGPRSDGWWTGRRPSEEGEVPGRREDGRISSLPQLVLRDCTKQVRLHSRPARLSFFLAPRTVVK